MGELVNRKRVAKIMRDNGIRAVYGYKKPRVIHGRPMIVASNRLDRQFFFDQPDRAWVTDITYIRTWQGWLYLAVVIDLFFSQDHRLVYEANTCKGDCRKCAAFAVWRRQPKSTVIVHSDQGSQYGSDDWLRFCKQHNLEPSMSRRGNCWDNAVAESFFSSLKKERIKKRIYKTREMARADIFDYIEMFYNPTRRHSHLNGMSPEAFEAASN